MNARDGGRQDDVYHGLPPRRAERETRLLERPRDGVQRVGADGEDGRHDHDGEDERGREDAETGRQRERRAEERHEEREADVAVDDGRNRDVEIDGRPHDALHGHGRELRKEDGAEEAEGRTNQDGEQRRFHGAEDERQRAEMLRARVPRRLVKNSTGLTSARVKSPCLPTKKIIEKIISVMRQADAMKRQRPHLS